MSRSFNITGDCKPQLHYMADIRPKLIKIKEMIDRGDYFTINRARQYGKTTTLRALSRFLEKEYLVISLDFQMLSHANFSNEQTFTAAFAGELLDRISAIPDEIQKKLLLFAETAGSGATLLTLFRVLSQWCGMSAKPVILMVDEVDSSANNQVFVDFLAQLRGYYINRDQKPTFHSVILASVYDIKNLKCRFSPDEAHLENSPWNIAADFLVDLSLSAEEIAKMLDDYEHDRHTGMDIQKMSHLLYEYTSGYPFLVSKLCKLMDERPSQKSTALHLSWTKDGFLTALRLLLAEPNSLFDSLIHKLREYPDLNKMLYRLLFTGKEISYVVGIPAIEAAMMFGFVKISNHQVLPANRIFEMLLYNLFLTAPSMQQETIYDAAQREKTLFIEDGHLNMKTVLERFIIHFDHLYGSCGQQFYEDDGRRYFMLFLKPIINGVGNCYIEAETRNRERTDLIVDYCGEQFIIETKIWHGYARHLQGEKQLANYLDSYHLNTGYMLTFNFNKTKEVCVKEVLADGKRLIEAFV